MAPRVPGAIIRELARINNSRKHTNEPEPGSTETGFTESALSSRLRVSRLAFRGDAVEYTFEMTPERARAAASELEAILWLQNERLYQRLRARMPWRRHLRIVGMLLATLGLLLAGFGAIFSTRLRIEFMVAAALFVFFFLVFQQGERLSRALRRGTRKLVANRARRAMSPVLRHAPYTIEYTLDGERLTVQVEMPPIRGEVEWRQARLAILGSTVVCVFAAPLRQRPLRVVYVPGPLERRALQDAFIANEIETIGI